MLSMENRFKKGVTRRYEVAFDLEELNTEKIGEVRIGRIQFFN